MNLKSVIPIILISLSISAFSQQSYSTRGFPTVTDKTMTVVIPNTANITVDGQQINDGDSVGAFYDSLGTETIAGLGLYSQLATQLMTVYGNSDTSAVKDGFDENEIMVIKIHDNDEFCVVENYDFVLTSGLVTWREGVSDTLNSWTGSTTLWGYNFSTYCTSSADTALPFLSGIARHATYSSSPEGLEIDSLTGGIVPAQSDTGTYTIVLNTGSCLTDTSFTITIESPNASITYTDTSFCASDTTEVLPVLNNISFATFSSTPPGLVIDQFTGLVEPDQSSTGKYTIMYSTTACLDRYSTKFEVAPETNVFSYPTDSMCVGMGTSYFPEFTSPLTVPYSFHGFSNGVSVDTITGEVDVASSSSGSYDIHILTEACLANDVFSFVVLQPFGQYTYPTGDICLPAQDEILPVIVGDEPDDPIIFSSTPGIILDSSSGTINTSLSTSGIYNIAIASEECLTSYEETVSLIDADYGISYASDTYCPSFNDTIAPLTINTPAPDIQFFSTPPGLDLNLLTGFFSVQNSNTGTYEIMYSSSGCYNRDTLRVTIDSIELFIAYPETELCGSSTPTLSPMLTGDTTQAVSYQSPFPGLVIDENSGVVDVVSSNQGIYTIELSSDACINVQDLTLEVQQDSLVISYDTLVFCQRFVNELNPNGRNGLIPADIIYRTNDGDLVLDTITGVIDPSASEPGIYEIVLNSKACILDTVIEIEILEVDGTITYSSSEICQGETATLAPVTGVNLDSVGFFTYSPGLEIDTVTGTVNINTSTPGVYIIGFTTDLCLADTGFSLSINEALELSESDFDITSVDCETNQPGEVELISSPSSPSPITYVLIESVSLEQTVQTDSLNVTDLNSGNYLLQATDAVGCSTSFVFEIDSIPCINDPDENEVTDNGETIIVPGSVDAYGNVTVNCASEVIYIYDRNATLVRKLEGIQTWDGRNDDGDLVSSGLYIFYCGADERIGEVTVLYK